MAMAKVSSGQDPPSSTVMVYCTLRLDSANLLALESSKSYVVCCV